MATLDQLSPDRRAIIELVTRQGRSYEEIATMLGMGAPRVRDLARDALVTLSPLSAARVEDEWRGQVGDFVLGQQSGPEAVATREHLKQSEWARAWVLSLGDSLDELFGDGRRPELPDRDEPAGAPRRSGRRNGSAPATATTQAQAPGAAPAAEGGGVSTAAQAIIRRRRIAGALIGVLLLATVGIGAFLLLRDGDDDQAGRPAPAAPAAQDQGRLIGQGELQAVGGGRGAGVAAIAERGGKRQLAVQAAGLRPSTRRDVYQVWLFNTKDDAVSLGAQVADAQGNFMGAGELPPDFAKYRFVDISREPVDRNQGHSGNSVLRASLASLLSNGGQGAAPQPGQPQQPQAQPGQPQQPQAQPGQPQQPQP